MSTIEQGAPPPGVSDTGCVACIGIFDGVHRGHRALVAAARERADALGLPLVAITFVPHPKAIVNPDRTPTSLSTVPHRVALLIEAGADAVDVLEFDRRTAATEPEQFVEDFLVRRLGVREVVVGEGFRFGNRAAGSIETLVNEGRRWGFSAQEVPLAGSYEKWSSTLTRRLLGDGDVSAASDVLGRPYRLDGTVVHGDHRGRELGFPTANLQWTESPTIPADGVYAGWVNTTTDRFPAAISVGTNPQFDGRDRRVEAYVLDRDDLDLYGQSIGVEFADRIRGQETFSDVAGLVGQIGEDVVAARTLLGISA